MKVKMQNKIIDKIDSIRRNLGKFCDKCDGGEGEKCFPSSCPISLIMSINLLDYWKDNGKS